MIKLNLQLIKVLAIIILILLCIGSGVYINYLLKERTRVIGNYNAQVQGTTFWYNKANERISRVAILNLTLSETKHSKDATIQELNNKAEALGLKNRRLESMLSIKADTVVSVETKVDTAWFPDKQLVYIDSLSIGKLHIKRVQDITTLKAKYDIRYNPNINVFVSWIKEDKWKIKNIFVPRKKTYVVDVVTDDKLLNVKNLKAVNKY